MKVKKKALLVSGAVVMLSACLAVYGLFFSSCYRIDQTAYVYVDNDDTVDSVYTKIQQTAHPACLWGYSILNVLRPMTVHPGRYAIQPDEGVLKTYRKMATGNQAPVNLTIPSVRTADRLAGVLGRKLMIDSTDVYEALCDSAFCASLSYNPATIMALFIPNTYQVYWNISLEDLMKRMQKENEKFWQAEGRSELAAKLGLTHNEVITLASIVEEETANNAEKPMVAGMYLNRLKQEMPLQADPTIKFALQDFSLRRIYHKHLVVESPYNTYKNTGLPPGPIRIPSVASIDAVLHRVDHDFLYMCAKEDFSGTHNFARTYNEHLQNARRYTEALNQRNIK